MSVSIQKASSRRQLRKFIDFPEKLYRGCENWVPPLRGDEFDTFNPRRNGAYEFCEAECYLAFRGSEIVGRVAAIVNHKANEIWGMKVVRFGWLDFIEDEEVLSSLVDSVREFGRVRGCTFVKGPLGFTDMDKEGLLVEGFQYLSPFTCLYNYPYYDTLLQKIGFSKDVDWTQKLVHLGSEMPPTYKFASLVEERTGLHIGKFRSTAEMARKCGKEIFHLYNEAFAPLFQFTPLTEKQIGRYLKTYVPILDTDFTAVCLDADEKPVGFAFCVPSLAAAVKKSRGRLLPFGIFRILRALKHNDTLDALLVGVLPQYQGTGATLLLFKHIHENCERRGIDKIIMNPQLEDNVKVQMLVKDYEHEVLMRRRAYISEL